MPTWNDPTDEQRDAWREWLADRPPSVRAVAERFDPWTVYRLKTTGQACQIQAFDESGTVRAYCQHPGLGGISGVGVAGIDPDDFELWPDGEPHDPGWVMTRLPNGFAFGPPDDRPLPQSSTLEFIMDEED